MKAILVDNEVLANEALAILLRDYCPNVEIVDTCTDTISGEQSIIRNHPDLVFLDIDMPGEGGLGLIERLRTPDFEVVFATAYNEYAVRAFQLSALDYITKPLTATQVVLTVQKATERIGQKRAAERFSVINEMFNGSPRRIILNTGKVDEVVYFDNLICCKSDGHCTFFHIAGKEKPLVTSTNLGAYIDTLEQFGFMQTHRAWLINEIHIARFHHADASFEMSNGMMIPLGRVYKQAVLAQFRR